MYQEIPERDRKRVATVRWDGSRRDLWLGDLLVKQFRSPAAAQECILATFQEDGWPPRIDDPLPCGKSVQLPQDRLRDVVRSLNRNQRQGRIRFSCDGTGQGILWDVD